MNQNSIHALASLSPERISKSQARILRALDTACAPLSREQLAAATGLRLSAVCGRVNELVAASYLEVNHKGAGSTGRTVDFLIPTDKAEHWLDGQVVR